MLLKLLSEMMGQPLPKFSCSRCQHPKAEILWQGLDVEIKSGMKLKRAEGDLYLCRSCAVDLCLGLLRDVSEIEKCEGKAEYSAAWQDVEKSFGKLR